MWLYRTEYKSSIYLHLSTLYIVSSDTWKWMWIWLTKTTNPVKQTIIPNQCTDSVVYMYSFSSIYDRYGLVEQIDSQLMRIGHDLRDVIEQMNSTSSTTTSDNEDGMNEVQYMIMIDISIFIVLLGEFTQWCMRLQGCVTCVKPITKEQHRQHLWLHVHAAILVS